ncbi:SpoIIE family protein phosphatase [Salinibacterium sp. SYSU T00001]|uniref:SpoIIE family protein phosphatase n=1 Tax=Homoserinimonas sedimenticola TaxID=2986805 RepID=UPI0022366FF1|nr:SpoIIE family protein phosphatase [Salinibacterium sedimenticola]MCW4386096.1 SpoIIE family protein phosphatase [Salinibacterium sedimenticola]
MPPRDDTASRARTISREAVIVLSFAAAYVLAALLARLTVLPQSGISMVWPAAAVSVLWVIARAGRRSIWIDYCLMAFLTALAVGVTGGTVTTSVVSGIAAVVQAAVCTAVIARRCPRVWRSRGTEPLDHKELWWFFIAAAAGPIASAPSVEINLLLTGAAWDWDVILLWCARNMGSIVVLAPLAFVAGARIRRPAAEARSRIWKSPTGAWSLEAPLLLILSPLVHLLWFAVLNNTVVVFPLLALACVAGARLPSALVTLHSALIGVVTIAITALGWGPFLGLGDAVTQIALAQLYVGLVCAIGLALALDRDARDDLSAALSTARDAAQGQAELFSTIVGTMAEGVRVVDENGAIIVRNAAATRLLVGDDVGQDVDDLSGIRNLDGSALAEDELPYRRSLEGHDVRDHELLVRPSSTMEARDERIVSFTTARLPRTAGGGVVTVLRDVTLERQELHRAAQVQRSLLPTEAPRLPGYDLAAHFVPAGSVGGDFYDWYGADDGVVLTLADVMGKGPGAAILAATTRSLLRAHDSGADVAASLTAAEVGLMRDLGNTNAFVTLFRAFVHAPSGRVSYSDAGHGLSAIVSPDGRVRRLSANGMPLGVLADETRAALTEQLDPGELLLIVSDGVLDALGGSLEGMAPVWEQCARSASAQDAVTATLELASHGDVDDDLTVLALRRRP